jgi:hypothetical protein
MQHLSPGRLLSGSRVQLPEVKQEFDDEHGIGQAISSASFVRSMRVA